MKKNKCINILIVIVTILTISSCEFEQDFESYVIKDVSHPCDVTLTASDSTCLPSTIHIHLIGEINGECTFEIQNGVTRYNTIKLKDRFDYLYSDEWYDSHIHVRYIPVSKIIGDSVVVKYQFI